MGLPDGYAVDMELHCFLGHGASGSAASMTPYVNGLQARGIAATAIDLPTSRAPRTPSRPSTSSCRASRGSSWVGSPSAVGWPAWRPPNQGAPYAALVLFSYPLHPPGSPEKAEARTSHWPQIRCPVLLLSGESDPFAKIDLLRAAVPKLGGPAELVTYPKLGHGLMPVLDDVLDRVAAFLADQGAARYVRPLALTVLGPYGGPPPGGRRPRLSPAWTNRVAAGVPQPAGPQARPIPPARPSRRSMRSPHRLR